MRPELRLKIGFLLLVWALFFAALFVSAVYRNNCAADSLTYIQFIVIAAGFVLALTNLVFLLRTNRSVHILSTAADSIGQGKVKPLTQFYPGQYLYPLAKSIRENGARVESYIQTMTEQKSQLESILDGIEEGILLINAAGRIHSSNRAARNMFSSVVELKGRRPLEIIRNPELQAACNRVLAKEIHSFHSEVAIESERFCHFHIVRVEQSEQEYGAIIALHDISELKRLEKIRRDFVANASHELRTPLTSIKGYTEMLMTDESDAELRNSCLEVILKNADNMIKIVNDLLQLARVEDYDNTTDMKPVNSAEAFMEAWRACAPMAEQRNVVIESDFAAEGPLVRADYDQLVQLFRNLLENAVRYSPPGAKVEVFSELREGEVKIAIGDYGPGIPRQDQQRIFERFFRVERHRGKEAGSTGLGLAICRHILKNHGGAIWVESPRKEMSSGSIFFFTLPAA